MFHPGDVLRKWRNKRGIGLVELARLSGVDKGTISKIENGSSYRQPTIEKLCAAFNRTPLDVYAELVAGAAKPGPASASPCPDADPTHEQFHALLEKVLHSGDLKCIHAVVAVLEVAASDDFPSSGSLPSDKKHGPFPPIAKPARKHA
jgi:transcriptional regulator with XRE-family HTH domain